MFSIIYYVILLLILFYLILAINKCNKKVPRKIKYLLILSMLGLFFRNLSILFLSVTKSSSMAYTLKNIVYLDYLLIPIIIICIYYVYFRINKLSFNKVYIISSIFIIFYLLFMFKAEGTITLSSIFGYIVKLNNSLIYSFGFILIMLILVGIGTLYLNKESVSKRNLIELLIIIVIIIIESITIMIKINPMPYCIISEGLLIISLNRCIKTFNNREIS